MKRLELPLWIWAFFMTACGSTPADPAPDEATRDRYVLVHLVTGARARDLTQAELATAIEGHFANMARLASERSLLLAGPLGEPRADPLHRGVFLFDVAEPEAALELARTDPAVQAGVFELRARALRSDAPFRRMLARSDELVAAAGDDWQKAMRGYVLVTAPDAARAAEQLAGLLEEGRVLFDATFADGGGWYALDASSADEARALLEFAGVEELERWSLSPWYATRAVEDVGASS